MTLTGLTLLAWGILAAPNDTNHDWPQWRGPNRDGVCTETGLLATWPDGGPRLLWKVTDLGGGFTTPAIAGGRLFGMSYQGDREVVWALDARTGQRVWTTPIANKGKAGYNDGPRSTPTVDGNRLYAVGISGDLVCLDVASGKLMWRKNFRKDFNGRMMSGWGFSESPLIDGDRVIVTPGSDQAAMVALDKKTGRLIWRAPVRDCGGAGYASVMPAEVGGTRLYLTWFGSGLIAVRARDGKFLWKYDRAANTTANIPTPIVKDEYIFCSTAYGAGSALLKLVAGPDGTINVEEQYFLNSKDIQNHHGGMVLVGDYVYLGHGHNNGFPRCVELKTGKQVWSEDRGPGKGSAAVLFADGKLYFRYQNGVMALIDAKPDECEVISTFELPEQSGRPSWPHPVIANGRLYIRDQGVLLCFNLRAGQ